MENNNFYEYLRKEMYVEIVDCYLKTLGELGLVEDKYFNSLKIISKVGIQNIKKVIVNN